MPKTPSIHGLYLRYRIWIAEMNADVTMIRIFDDYPEDIAPGKKDMGLKKITEEFKNQFAILRQEMDELKHEMHLQKMKLAAHAREGKEIDKKLYQADNHAALKKRYYTYRNTFNKMKTDFGLIGNNWID